MHPSRLWHGADANGAGSVKSATGALLWSLTYVFPDRFTVVVQLHSVVASVGPLVE
eukprot:COSAG04_NODE_15895_length_517_cov_0.471292_2_plen_55_part_01